MRTESVLYAHFSILTHTIIHLQSLWLVKVSPSEWEVLRCFPVPYGEEVEPGCFLEWTTISTMGWRMDDFGDLYGGEWYQLRGPIF